MKKFSIRDVFWLVLVVAMGLGWWLDRSHVADNAGRYKEGLMKLRRIGFGVGDIIQSPELAAELDAEWEAEHARRKIGKK